MRSVRAMSFGLALLSTPLINGCVMDEIDVADDKLGEVSQLSQCGPGWDVQQVERYDGTLGVTTEFVRRHEPRVGYHVNAGCSGTLISDDLFVSAGHCGYQVGHTVRFDYQIAPDGTARPTRDFTVAAVVEQEHNASWDYAIVRLNGSPGREYGHASIASIDPPAGSLVTIMGHPNRVPKIIHAGPVVDYASSVGTNWFRHRVDTEPGSSGSGVLNNDGQLVGIHTNAGCATSDPIQGNSAMRMSQLVPHSPTLRALARSKILWRHDTGKISIWSLEENGTHRGYAEHGPFDGWTPVSLGDNRVLWQHQDGRISYWVINDDGAYVTHAESGPFAGWTAVNHANDRVLWKHTSGLISLWTVNDVGNYVSHVEYGPYPGWTVVNYANNHLLWRHDTGKISLWRLDDAGNHLRWIEYGPYAGWTALSYSNGEIQWRHSDGRSSLWTVDRDGNHMTWLENGPFGGWTPVANADRRRLWRNATGQISYWTTNSDGGYLSHVEHGPFNGWTALFTTGGAP